MKLNALERTQRIREKLFQVLTEFPVLYQARQGVGSKIVNPFASLEQVVRTHVNPLILYINDLIQEIQEGLPYLEALDRLLRFALRHKYRGRVLEAVVQLARIEGDRPYFLRGLAHLLDAPDPLTRARELQAAHRKLHLLNRFYTQRFGSSGDVDLIPWRVTFQSQVDGLTEGTYEHPVPQQLETFRQAIWALVRLIREHRLDRWIRRGIHRRIQGEILELSRLLFDYGYTVEDICGRVAAYEKYLGTFLNTTILDDLEATVGPRMDLHTTSKHVMLLALLDYRIMIPFRIYYQRLADHQQVMAMAREIERLEGIKVSPLRRIILLYRRYQEFNHTLLAYFLDYQFSRTHGDYLPSRDRKQLGIEMTKQFVLRYFNNKEFQKKIEESTPRHYSSKASEEMTALLQLLVQALSKPETIRGKKVNILGHIQSMAMGKVLIAIYRGNIVALKERKPTKGSSMPISEQVRRLEYEARIHTIVQSGTVQHENVVECFGVIQETGRRFLAIGYHPAETLSSLVRRTDRFSRNPDTSDHPPLLLVDLKTISVQLLRVLLHLKSKQVIHRDLKPSNILYLLEKEGRVGLIKVIDFGVAVCLAEGHPIDIHEGHVVGTLSYMAPEMVTGKADYGSDLFSAGVMLYQLMSGRLPLTVNKANSREELNAELKRLASSERLSLREANPPLAAQSAMVRFVDLVEQMIERDPTKRPPLARLYQDWVEAWRKIPVDRLPQPLLYSV